METSFWFVFVGLSIYILHFIQKYRPVPAVLLFDLVLGAGISVLIAYLRPVNFGYGITPLWFIASMGGLAGLMIWTANHLKLFESPSFKYSIAIILSCVHAGIMFLMYTRILLAGILEFIPSSHYTSLFIQILLISALSFIGFSFPLRMLRLTSGKT